MSNLIPEPFRPVEVLSNDQIAVRFEQLFHRDMSPKERVAFFLDPDPLSDLRSDCRQTALNLETARDLERAAVNEKATGKTAPISVMKYRLDLFWPNAKRK